MTEPLYFSSDELTCRATVLSCEALEDGHFAVRLDRTLFHPKGGGQPGDRGSIGGVAVENTVSREGEILHITAQAVPEGETEIRVDAEVRALHSRLHSAGHLIGTIGDLRGWHAIKGDHFPGQSRVVFTPPEGVTTAPSPEEAAAWQAELDQCVTAALPRRIGQEGELRTVTWGDLPAYPCGGTHVASTAEIGRATITKMKLKKGQLSVSYSIE